MDDKKILHNDNELIKTIIENNYNILSTCELNHKYK